MRIINQGSEKEYIVTCQDCKSDIAYQDCDCKFSTMTVVRYSARIIGKPQKLIPSREKVKYIICPVCGAMIILPTFEQFGAKIVL